jgi:UDP-glucose 4-epimerase
MQKFLVTGAAGFIGSHSVDWLLRQGYAVVGVDNLRTGRLENLALARLSPHFEFVKVDVSDAIAMQKLFQKHRFSGMLHHAALVSMPESFQEPALNYRIDLVASDLLTRLCVEHSCKRLVFVSSAAVYGNNATLPNCKFAEPHPLSPYKAAKLDSEIMLLGHVES